jgi:hypothetical protein
MGFERAISERVVVMLVYMLWNLSKPKFLLPIKSIYHKDVASPAPSNHTKLASQCATIVLKVCYQRIPGLF